MSREHGFMKGKLCLTNLIAFHNEVANLVSKEKGVDVVYLNISKAFDMVSHKILIDKMTKYGSVKRTENWLEGHCVISGPKSTWRPVSSSVPQEWLLVPIMFNLFTKDLDDGSERTVNKFAMIQSWEGSG